jgi:peptidoglycan/xylan/chitin deacetylase (PgdA/CDA1 family)
MLPLLIAPLASGATVGLAYLFCYGGFEGPVDWSNELAHHGSRDRRSLALTFDDGPDPVRTPLLLELLAKLDIKATFFLLGKLVDEHPKLAARIVAEGHEIGNHTYNHRYLPLTRSRTVAAELAATDRAIERATGITPTLARPPYGGRSPSNVRVFARLAKRLVLWDVNSYDWKGHSADEVARRVVDEARPGSIILMHEARTGGETTIEAVRTLVPVLRADGFDFVTVSDALA